MDVQEIWSKYDESFSFLQKRKLRQVNQLVLLNNLQRGEENIASTMLITLFNRTLANLYDDKMQVKFVPGEEMDQKKVNSLNVLAQNDYREMKKQKLDYDWNWDTLFFGRGYMETLRFNKKKKLMEPVVINPLVFGYDPFFPEPRQWRYYWKWVSKNKHEMQKLIKDGIITGVTLEEIPSGMEDQLWNFQVKRDAAKGGVAVPPQTQQNDVYQILEFFGYNDDGDKCIYWVDKGFQHILYTEKLDLKDAEDGIGSEWPIVVKEAYREPHSSIVFSVADLIDDKHRAKSVLLNLAFIAAKDKANPLYGYNPDKIRDVTQLFNRQISQHIPMDDKEAMWPLNTENPMDPGLQAFIQVLTQEATDPIGSGLEMAPAKKGAQTATHDAIQQQLNDLAQSLQSKTLQFGETDFWVDWYHRYRANTKEGDEKIATITGVKGMTFEKINMGDFQSQMPPGVLIFSAKDAEYKELVLRRDLMQMYPNIQAALDPDGMKNFNKYVFFPKFLSDPTMMDLLFPKSVDEIKAEEENDVLATDEMPKVADTDNHEQHLIIHQMAKKTWATWIHMAWHEELLAKQKQESGGAGGSQGGKNEVSESINYKDLPPDGQVQMAQQAGIKISPPQPQDAAKPGAEGANQAKGKQVSPGTDKKSPMSAASPLKQTMGAGNQLSNNMRQV